MWKIIPRANKKTGDTDKFVLSFSCRVKSIVQFVEKFLYPTEAEIDEMRESLGLFGEICWMRIFVQRIISELIYLHFVQFILTLLLFLSFYFRTNDVTIFLHSRGCPFDDKL